MRNVVLYMQSTLNGYAIGPDEEMDWLTVTDQTWEVVGSLQESCDTVLVGRATYQEFEAFWPAAAQDASNPPGMLSHANWLADHEKVIFSRTLEKTGWSNTRIVSDNLVGEVNKLKSEPGKDLLLLGGPSTVSSFARHDLIDEAWILLNPATVSGGKQLLTDKLKFRLIEARPFTSGVIALHYGRPE